MGWKGSLGLLIGLLAIALSIYLGLNSLSKTINSAKVDIISKIDSVSDRVPTKGDLIAITYAFSKTFSERREIRSEDIKEGYSLAKRFLPGHQSAIH